MMQFWHNLRPHQLLYQDFTISDLVIRDLFTSKINKEFEYSKKIKLLEVLWEIILVDGKIHDFESNLVRRLSGLLYVSDIDCGIAKKRALTKD